MPNLITIKTHKYSTLILVLAVAIIGTGLYSCKKEEPQNENASPGVSLEEKLHSKIVFCSNRDGNREIYVMNSDGSEK